MNEVRIPIEKISTIEWMVIPLFLILISYAIIRHMQVGIIGDTLRQYFSFSLSNQVYKRTGGLSGRLSMALILNSIIAMSILVYKLFITTNFSVNPYILYGLILGGILVLFVIKLGIVNLVQGITEPGDVLEKARHYSSRYYEIIGVLLLPGIIAVLFFPQSTDIDIQLFGQKSQNIGSLYCLLLLSILYIIKLLQSVRQSLDVKISWYYIILYLCTLEILPLVVIYRLLVGEIWMFN